MFSNTTLSSFLGTIKFPEGTSWFKLNSRQVGFYRVNYTAEQWMNFTQLLTDDIKVNLLIVITFIVMTFHNVTRLCLRNRV